ncbi:MAG TPA: MlaD family protein [Bryobacteraceae bacterium]|nr:MlaD family protein [Bryobacteraceae bacterium]
MSKELRLGAFIVGTLFIFGAGIFWIGSRDFRFTSTYRLYADFKNVAGLGEGAAVRVGGIHQGAVHRIWLPKTPDQKVRVEMDLREATRNVIRKDSTAVIRTEGLVGDQYVEVGFGSPEAPRVNNGDTINAEPPLQLADMLKKTDAILDSAQGAMRNIDQTAGNLETVSSELKNGKGTMGALVNDRSVYEHVRQATANLQEDTEALKHNFLLRGYFKKRGYEDITGLTKDAIPELPAAAPEKRLTYPGAKLFEKPDTAKIKNAKILDETGRYLEQNSYGLAVVACYAGQKGDSEKQAELTLARSAVVRDYLAQHFKLDDKRIKTFAGGKSPDAPDGGEVQVVIYKAGTGSGAAKGPQ